ncbi:MAG: TMEM165/GDT1 family protein, partial [Dolichospermum sp.]
HKTKLEPVWLKDVSDSFDCTDFGAPALVTLAKILGKLWPHRCPDWVPVCKAKAQEAVEKADLDNSQLKSVWSILLKSFVLTFIAEWGDRTQLATIALAASNNPIGVTAGAILGHAICAAIAVIGGKLIAGKISERQITFLGGFLFIIFGIVAAIEGK